MSAEFCVRCDIEVLPYSRFVHRHEEVNFTTAKIEHAEPLCDRCYQYLQEQLKRRGRKR